MKQDPILGQPITITSKPIKRRRIQYIGLELEGGWDQAPSQLGYDGSVQGINRIHVGELRSPKLTYSTWETWLRTNYPSEVNDTCGLHVHFSFASPLMYARLVCREYPATIVSEVRKWAERKNLPASHPLWARLKGKSQYCQHLFQPHHQIAVMRKTFDHHTPGHRYTVINYPYNRLSTIECRLLSMMASVDEAKEAVDVVLDTTELFLVTTAKKEVKVSQEFVETSGTIKEVHIRV